MLPTLYLFNRRKNSNVDRKGREGAITRILILMSIAFLIFTVATISCGYVALIYLQPKLATGDDSVAVLYALFAHLLELPATMNVSFNFLFYLIGSKLFRNNFVEAVRKLCGKKVQVQQATSISLQVKTHN